MKPAYFCTIAIAAYFWVGPRLWQKISTSQAKTVSRPSQATFGLYEIVVAH